MHELVLLKQLSELSSRLWAARNPEKGLQEMLAATIKLLDADMGNIQLLQRDSGYLHIVAQEGFKDDFLNFFREVSVSDGTSCGRALQLGQQIFIEDVETAFSYQPFRQIAQSAGFRTVLSTPLIAGDGLIHGVISTYFRQPSKISQTKLECLDLYARQAANFIERSQLDSALQRSEARFRRSFESNMVPMGIWTTWGSFIDANNSLLSFLGYTLDDVKTGKLRWDAITPEEWREADELALAECEEKGWCTPFEKVYRRKDGSLVPVIVGGALFEDDSGEGICFVFDLTERKKIEEALKAADRRKDEFLATLAHELRNPLAPILNGVQALLRAEKSAPQDYYVQLLTIMDRQATHLVRLVDELLEVSRISQGKVRLVKRSIDISEVLREALETSGPHIEKGKHKVALDLPTGPLPVFGDPLRLAQAFTNLINNAAKYTPSAGRIEITARREKDDVVVDIRDTGIGLAAEDLPHVFELFVQVGNPPTIRAGLGIGLALVRSLIELHDGKVDVLSDGLGKGSTFKVRLPLSREPQVNSTSDKVLQQPDAARGLRVLVIDNDGDVADSFGLLLKSLGADVRVAYDGLSGIADFTFFEPSLIFIDLGMPGIDGYETARRIRASFAGDGPTLVALTGWGQDQVRAKTREAGFNFHLTKPASLASIEELLAAPASSTWK